MTELLPPAFPPAPGPAAPWAPVPPPRPARPYSRREQKQRHRRRAAVGLVGVIGELMITLGALLALYVVWELVWTDVEAHQEAAAVVELVEHRTDWIEPNPVSPYAPHRDPATEAPPVDEAPLATPSFGDSWALLHVPRWGLDYNVPIVEGTDRVQILNKGLIGHYLGTEGPGRIGNFATSAHRTTYGKPYNLAAELEDGDSLIVETAEYYFVYRVYGREIVYPDAVRVIWPVPNEEGAVPTRRLMTLTTCHPMFSARQRYVVWGELAYWTAKADGPLEELAG
ncbi:MAG: class E sortase [Bifidobacteriaceae bacterium]|jgi:sortase A|nr:class E sortase [Bifidobacteriaceae bacterium]